MEHYGADRRAMFETIAIDPRNANNLFVSTLDGQVHASYDAGSTWKLLVNLNRPRLILDNLIVDARDSNVLYTSGHRHKPAGRILQIDRWWNNLERSARAQKGSNSCDGSIIP